MRGVHSIARLLAVTVPFAAIVTLTTPVLCQQNQQQTSSPPGGNSQSDPASTPQTTPQSTPKKPSSGKKNEILDPTADPMKDPAYDITKDPTKVDPTKVDPAKVDTTKLDTTTGNLGGDAGDIAPEAPDYTGPAILSRSFALSRPAVPVNERLRFFAGVNLTYDSGLLGAYVQNGPSPSISAEGLDFNWGVSGKHYRRKDIFEINYAGHFYEYFGNSKFSGQDHSFSGGYTRQVSPRLTYGFRETAGLYSNTYSVLNSTAISDVSQSSATIVVAPNTEAFDDRTYFSTSSGTLTYHKTARLSFSLSGSFFLVRRDSIYLADSNGYQASADVAYRITRRQSFGLYYSHSAYYYRKIFGDSAADSVGLDYSIALTKHMDLSLRGGGTRYDSQTLQTVVPNPLVQQILGITTGIEKFYIVGYSPDLTATLTRNLRRSSIGASFTEGITPGNGLVLTSKRQSESVFWSLPTFRKYATQLGGGRDILSGYANGQGTAGSYASYYLRYSLSRPISRSVSSYMNIDYRQYGFGGTTFHQHEYRISLGFRFSPGEGPIKLW